MIMMVEHKAFFVRNRMGNGQSQRRCDQKTKLRAGQIRRLTSQSLNPEGNQGNPYDRALR